MLNRNNLTLSALFNRLNLGTRSLVLASVNNGDTVLRIRHTYHDAMREHMAAFFAASIPVEVQEVPPITGPVSTDLPRNRTCGDSLKSGVDSASRVLSSSWRGWQASRSPGDATARLRQSSRTWLAAFTQRIVDLTRRPSRSLGIVEKASAAWTAASQTAARPAANAAIAES